MLFFIYAIIGMQVGESLKLEKKKILIIALWGCIKKVLWRQDDDEREDLRDGGNSSELLGQRGH